MDYEFYIGEALIGDGFEVAHIDLIIGSKDGPVGHAFASALASPKQGHTPMLAVIRPNLPPKPSTLIVPKVTVVGMEDANKIFGPAQAAVAKAVADAVEEGIIPGDKCDEWVVIVSVFVHPKAEDYRKIYQFNYGATKTALMRALENYPGVEKILREKDRAVHPIMGFKVPRLWNPPYLQVALDLLNINDAIKVVQQLPKRERLILEVGTPLIKAHGVKAVEELRKVRKDAFIIADLKTMDVGRIEVKEAAEATADGICILGVASNETIERAVFEAKKHGIYSILDMMEVKDIEAKLASLKLKPDVLLLHRSVDVERTAAEKGRGIELYWGDIKGIKKKYGLLIAVAGGITPDTALKAINQGVDIIVVGRYIIRSKDPYRAAQQFLDLMPPDSETMRLLMDEDEMPGD
jgi:bifunctional enzyme Fae/Hps